LAASLTVHSSMLGGHTFRVTELKLKIHV